MSSRPTYSEEVRFTKEYNALASELAMFHDPDGKTDAEIAAQIVEQSLAEGAREWLDELVSQGRRFLGQCELPMSLIRTNANRYLVTEAEQRQWLQTLLERVQAELEVRKRLPPSKRA